MAISPSAAGPAVPVPLTVYGSWVTEVAPDAVPENISPDCTDVVFAPGSVGSRPALQQVLNSPFPAGGPGNVKPTVTYMKSFKTPTGGIKNLYLDSNGSLWVEDVINSPFTVSLLFQSNVGFYARSCTAFGREFIAISDGLHGADVPLQYDGTNLDRYTSDAPGNPPVVNSFSLPAVAPAVAGGRVDNITSASFSSPSGGHFYTLVVQLSAPDNLLTVGQTVVIAGNSAPSINGTYTVAFIIPGTSNTQFWCSVFVSSGATGSGGTATFSGISISRYNNLVTVNTASAHNLQVGYQALLANNGSLAVGGGITSIVINNETNPGLALVTTASAHSLKPNNDVTITGVQPTTVGGVTSAASNGSVTTLTTTTAHSLIPGAVIRVGGFTGADTIFLGTFTVESVPAPTQLVYFQNLTAYTTTGGVTLQNSIASSSSGTVSITWPIPDNTPTPTFFEVQTCPTPTSFYVQVTYTDGTWSTGSVGFPWDGTFYVKQVLSSTSFTYQQYGPDGSTTETSGTITPFGQCAPGLHLMAVCYENRQGDITAPSPFATFISNGGQYVSVTDIPIGPPNTVARILVFTGAQPNVPGVLPPFFYIPTIPQIEGQIVGTSTVINDNVTQSVVVDFGDNTLFAATGISIPGNDLASQIVIEGALGFGQFDSRLTTWGQRNTVNNLLNMGFDGGYLPSTILLPTGWQTTANTGAAIIVNAAVNMAWQVSVGSSSSSYGELKQSVFIDAYGNQIAQPNQTYKIRLQAMRNNGIPIAVTNQIHVEISSFTTGFEADANIPLSSLTQQMAFYEATFSLPMPASIPSDMVLKFSVQSASNTGLVVTIDNMSLIFTKTPYLDTIAFGSYVNNPAGIDGETGQFGANDPSKLMDMGNLRGTLNLVTQAPSGRLWETDGSASTEPSGWVINQVAANCGVLSAFGLTLSQADDEAASGGEEWIAWPSEGGVQIFGGGQPEKISQEIQPNWYDPSRSNTSIQINPAAQQRVWGLNDPVQRLLMFGLPIGGATAPNRIYVLNYRNLGSAQAIAGSPPFHPSFSGKLIATDNSRKWAPWKMTMNCAARMYRKAGQLSLILGAGNGLIPGSLAGTGNVYLLNPNKQTDDDFGVISSYYTTYAFVDPEKAMALGLAGQRLLMAYIRAYCQFTGVISCTLLVNDLANSWPIVTTRTNSSTKFDLEFGGGMCTGDRIFIKFSTAPLIGQTDNGFVISRLTAFLKNAKLRIRGAAQ